MRAASLEPVLVVEDETRMSRALERFFTGEGFHVVVRRSVAEAREAMESRQGWAAFVVDVGLPDGNGLDLLEHARARGELAPALVLTARSDAGTLQRTQLHAAQFLPKPPRRENLRAFAEWARRHERDRSSELEGAVAALAERHGLSPRETETVLLACRGVARADLAAALDVKETTVRTLIRRTLQKTDHEHLGDLVREIHRSVFT